MEPSLKRHISGYKSSPRRRRGFKLCVLLFSAAFLLTSCQGTPESPERTPGPQGQDPPEQATSETTMDVDQPVDPDIILATWQAGAHADTFVVSEAGTNSSCARCHAPVNWIPTMEDMPETCSVCKFEVDPPPPLTAQADWTNIECRVCHITKKGKVEAEYAWLEIAPIEEYAAVASVNELCEKCHLAGDVPEHISLTVGGDHEGYSCTQCHDAHDVAASCSTSECHPDILSSDVPLPGHDDDHSAISCAACHDAGDLEVDKAEDTDEWITFTIPTTSGERRPFYSHNIVLEVDCQRCHFTDNPWGLVDTIGAQEP
jgi:hypothetical protein